MRWQCSRCSPTSYIIYCHRCTVVARGSHQVTTCRSSSFISGIFWASWALQAYCVLVATNWLPTRRSFNSRCGPLFHNTTSNAERARPKRAWPSDTIERRLSFCSILPGSSPVTCPRCKPGAAACCASRVARSNFAAVLRNDGSTTRDGER